MFPNFDTTMILFRLFIELMRRIPKSLYLLSSTVWGFASYCITSSKI